MLVDADINDLRENALWVIMDPWVNQLSKINPITTQTFLVGVNLNDWNNITMDKIVNYLPKIKYPLVMVDNPTLIIDRLKRYATILHDDPNSLDVLTDYMVKTKLSKIVYCGFHEQHCILTRPLGYETMSKRYECVIASELVCTFPWPEWKKQQTEQREDLRYNYIEIEKELDNDSIQ